MAVFASVRQRMRDPIMWTGVSQLLKTAFATVMAWILAAQVFNLEQAYLAPWAALLTVHATVFGTLRRSVWQAGASEIAARLCTECGPADVDDWIAKTNALGRAIDRAWSVLAEARESGRLNPRRTTARRVRAA
jgi:hypothetical protein